MKTITADDEIEDVLKNIGVGEGEELRESNKRKQTLEKFAQLRSRNPDTTLTLENTHTAFVQVDEEIEEFKDITVTSKKFEQAVTDLPEDYFDYLLQRAFTNHETAHILYSSWPALKKYIDKVENEEEVSTEQYVMMFKNFVNVLEDGAIEKFLRDSYRVEDELLALRSTLHEQHYMGRELTVADDVEYHYPFFYAVMVAALNIGVYDNKELEKLLDEDNEKHFFAQRGGEEDREMMVSKVIPKIEEYIPKIQSEKDAEKRMHLCYELWNYVRKYIEKSTTPGKREFEEDQKESEGDTYSPGVPENLSEAHGEQDGEPIIFDMDEDGSPAPGQDDIEDGGTGDGDTMEEKAKKGIRSEVEQGDGSWSDEIEELINALGAGDGIDELAIAEPGEVNRNRKVKAQRYGRRCEKIFQRRLRMLQRDKVKRGLRRGGFDSKQMINAQRGSTRVFKKTKEGKKKNYSCMIVVDRSGSMSQVIEDVELAAGAVAYGLEANGVDTSILDTHNSMTTLSKPFGSNVENHIETMFAGRVGGGTPLTSTVNFARQRMHRGKNDYPFMIIITDGRPRNVTAFKEQVRKANFPVLGMYMGNTRENVENQLSLYDKAVNVSDDDDVSQKLMSMIRGVIL